MNRPPEAQPVQEPPSFQAVLTHEQVEEHESGVMGNPRGVTRRVATILLTKDSSELLAMMDEAEDEALDVMLKAITEHEQYCRAALALAESATTRFVACLAYSAGIDLDELFPPGPDA